MEKLINNQKIKIDLTWTSIIRVVVVLLALVLLYVIRDIIAIVFVVFIIVAALNPSVSRLQKYLPRALAVIIVYFVIFGIFALFSALIFGRLASEIRHLANLFPDILNKYLPSIKAWQSNQGEISSFLHKNLQAFSDKLSQLTGNIFQSIISVFGGVVTAISVFVMSFYLLLEGKASKEALENIFPPRQRERTGAILDKFSEKMGSWFRGQLLLMLIVGVLDFIILTILRVDGALALATWGGLTEIIPIIGPIIGAIPAIIIATSSQGIWYGILVFALMLVMVQWIESQFIVPNVMKRAVGLSPIIIIIAILIGGKLLGVLGVILAVPIAALISVSVKEWDNIIKIYTDQS